VRNGLTVSVTGGPLDAGTFFIPGDISSAAFFIAAACILEGADIVIRDVGLNPTRMGFVNALQRMGADIAVTGKKERFEPYGDIRARYRKLSPTIVEADRIPLLIDEIPVLAVVASTVRGTTVMKGCAELRVKETDRIGSMVGNLRSLGVDAEAQDDTLVVHGKRERFTGASVRSFGDHRTAMSMAIAGLFADGSCEIDNVDCINTSFPEFFDIARHLVQ
jgi:3-phosphoshikimate 1-carboxyvinyltransferase